MTSTKALLYLLGASLLSLFVSLGQSAVQAQTSRNPSASNYYNRGNERQKQGDLKGAIEDYTFALTFDPQFAQAYKNRGVAHYLKRELEKAIAAYTTAIDLNR